MTEETKAALREITASQAKSERALACLESRIEILREELKDAATVIRRLKLAQENEKAFAREQADHAEKTRKLLARLETLLQKQSE